MGEMPQCNTCCQDPVQTVDKQQDIGELIVPLLPRQNKVAMRGAVAIQCLETVFKISPEDTHPTVSQPLTETFTNSVCKNDIVPLANSVPEDVKDEGHNYVKEEHYTAAVDCYTQALELDPNNAVYYCNRAVAQSKLSHYTDAIKDGKKAIAIDSKYSKAYGGMGLALTAMNK
ncbi:Small glutamine-rich tetratricopeptide repeat-containing protein beta [Lemmus lemmus]